MTSTETSTEDMQNANFPMDAEGHVYHVGLKKGQIANRICIVGDKSRADIVASFFDPGQSWSHTSSRGFVTHTGKYKGVPLTVTAIGMGTPMVDFMLREARAIIDGPMVVIRLGTCGTPNPNLAIGSIAVAKESVMCYQKFEQFYSDEIKEPKALDYYHLTKPIPCDEVLTELLFENLKECVPDRVIHRCLDVSTDSFYSTQGRVDPSFDDRNETLVDDIVAIYPDVGSFQMETYHMCHLAARSRNTMSVAACCIILAQRRSGAFLTNEEKHALEHTCGEAVLRTLAAWTPKEGTVMDDDSCVWNRK